jgi:hypothetical protein
MKQQPLSRPTAHLGVPTPHRELPSLGARPSKAYPDGTEDGGGEQGDWEMRSRFPDALP